MFRKAFAATLLFTFLFSMAAFAPSGIEAQSLPTRVIDINSAPLAVLEGVVQDERIAQRIIENRPYANKRQLLSRQLVSAEQYDEIKDRIVARRIEDSDDAR